ncbi:MAG: ABC transporter permease [Candidatus Riflebacteria bacterium]|nr:ABC transporter permease [Candidatus Riflebacteria bacterium]
MDQILLRRRPSADFTTGDLEALRTRVTLARFVEPRFFGRAFVAHGPVGVYMPVDGIGEPEASEVSFAPLAGRTFSSSASRGLEMECLVTRSAYRTLGLRTVEGPSLCVAERRFRVVGMVEDPPETDLRFQARIVVPFFWARAIWGKRDTMDCLVVAWRDSQRVEETIAQLRGTLDQCRAPGAYYLSAPQFQIQKRRSIVSSFMVLGTSQSLFCIVVAAMGIVNVMLASVVRRMRDFAIRVAMGAHLRDIAVLVLLESFLLGLVGAVIGIAVAVTVSPPLCEMISTRIREASGLRPSISVRGVVTPLVVCGLSGLLAGIIPALRARNMDLLSVLRAE